MGNLAGNIRFALRRLAQSPLFTTIAVITLAVGIGANTAIFSVVDAVLLRPLPFSHSDRLLWINFTAPGLGFNELPFSDGVYLYARKEQKSLQGLALYSGEQVNLSGEGEPVRVTGDRVTPGFFRLLGVQPLLGRAFTSADGQPGAEPVAILGYELWSSRFGADSTIIGRKVLMDGVFRRIVGVAPRGFDFPTHGGQMWRPFVIDRAHLNAGDFSFPAIARLKPGQTVDSVRADFQRLVAHMGEAGLGIPQSLLEKAGFAPVVRPLKERLVGNVRQPLLIILGTVAFVLLIACANVANLFLVRAEGRSRELALRKALGASRGNLAGLLFSESLLLSLLGGALGLWLAVVGLPGLRALAPKAILRVREVGLNGEVLLFTLAVSILAGLLFGSFPLFRGRAHNLYERLKESGRNATTGKGRGRTRNLLVAFQVAMALVLLVGSGLLIRSFQTIRSIDPGFRSRGVVTFDLALSRREYPTGRRAEQFWRRLLTRLEGVSEVESVAVTSGLPLSNRIDNGSIKIEDHPVAEGEVPPLTERRFVSPGYFQTLGIPLLAGRFLDEHDGADSMPAVVVNRSFAEHWWPGGKALGHRVRQDSGAPWCTIVGIVGNVRFRSLEDPPGDMVYFPLLVGTPAQPHSPRNMVVVLKAGVGPQALMPAVRQQVWALDPHLPIAHLQTLDAVVKKSLARTSFTMLMLGIAAAVALLLGTVGIYGVISFVVSQRRREIGVRIVLGATSRGIRTMVIRQGLVLAGGGIVIGLAAAFGLSRLLTALLYGVRPTDPLTYAGVSLLLLAVSILASYLPARRASGTDPATVLRQE